MTVSAIRIDPADNVICLLRDHEKGERPDLADGPGPALAEAVALGHKIALAPIAAGDPVIKYGVRIGHATAAIAPGDHVHLHNLAGEGP